MIGVPWEQCEVVWGNTSKNLPWTCISAGSQTTHAMTRAAHAAATDAIKKLQEIAAKIARRQPGELQGRRRPRVGRRPQHDARAGGAESDRARRQVRRPRAADRRQRLHEDVGGGARRAGPDGRRRATAIRATARRSPTSPASPKSKSIVETGKFHILEYTAVADVGTVINPRSLQGPDLRRLDARHRPRHLAEVGLRPALRRAARQAVPLQQAADDSRRAADVQFRGASNCPIRKRRSARAASASRRSAPATAR